MTLDDLKSLLNIDVADTSYDDILNIILNSAYQVIEKEIGYPLSENTYTERKLGKGDTYLSISVYPINTLISVIEKTKDLYTSKDITSEIDYETAKDIGYIRRLNNVFLPNMYYEITYTAGFSNLPDDLELVAREIALTMYSQIDRVKEGVDRIRTPDGTFYYSNDLITPYMDTILSKYRKVVI